MALITCPDCKTSISESAPSCPSCGRPEPAKTQNQIAADSALGVVGLLVMLWLGNAFLALVMKGMVKGVFALIAGPLVWMIP